MNEALYNAVFCYGEDKVDPFAACCVDFDRIIGDMKLVGYELTPFNIAHHIFLEKVDELIKAKNKIIAEAMDLPNKDDYCREKYGISFKDIDALDPRNDLEFDIKSGQVIFYLTNDAIHMQQEYNLVFKKELDQFVEETGFKFVSL